MMAAVASRALLSLLTVCGEELANFSSRRLGP
jgi:hypothetical protein